MSEIGENLKNLVLKGIEVIGTKANDIASSAKQKVGEFNLANEQKDLMRKQHQMLLHPKYRQSQNMQRRMTGIYP